MADTRHDVDIDLTVVPAQRTSAEDTLEIVHHAPATVEGARLPARPRVAPAWLVAVGASLVAGVAVGVTLGAVIAADDTTPVPSSPSRGGDLTSLLLDPVTSQPAQPAAPTDQQDLITRILMPEGSH